MKFFITLIFFLTLPYSQDINDIVNLSNKDLDNLKESLSSESLNSEREQVSNAQSKEPSEVVISSENNDNDNDINYFGYNYFQRDINFFDNIPTPADYVLGPGDEVILSLWGETNFRESFTLNNNGEIFYDNIGFINLANLTLEKAELKIKDKFSDIYSTLQDDNLSTRLNLELGTLKAINVYFTGNIRKPGIHLIHPFSDIFTAIVQADGIEIEGSLRQVQLIRNSKILHTVDFYSFFQDGLNSFSKIKLVDGDIIHIPNAINRVKIEGSVVRPAYYELLNEEKLDSVIGYALDLSAKASSTAIIDRVIPSSERFSDDNAITSINVNLNESNNIDLNNGDTITIPEIKDVSSKLEIFGRVKSPGKYSATNASLKSILDIAGGFNDPVYRKTINEEITVLRRDENQFYSLEFRVKYKDAGSFLLQTDDKIFVYENINYRQNFSYTILGEVNKPGTFPLNGEITIRDAIQLAGGVTEMGSINSLSVLQNFSSLNNLNEEVVEKQLVANADLDFLISDSNIIRVLPKTNAVNVIGNVFNPGLVAHNGKKNMTMSDAIELAGGYKPDTMVKSTYVVRANGEIDKADFFRGRTKKIFPGDKIVVPMDPNPRDFNFTSFIADLSSTLANIAAILVIIDRQ